MRLPLAFLVASACATTTYDIPETCQVEIEVPEDLVLVRGTSTSVGARPMSAVWDTRVRIGGVDVGVEEVTRTDCLFCDACRSDNDCLACGDCEPCDLSCDPCVEEFTLFVPDEAALGSQSLVLFNRHGTSAPTAVRVVQSP